MPLQLPWACATTGASGSGIFGTASISGSFKSGGGNFACAQRDEAGLARVVVNLTSLDVRQVRIEEATKRPQHAALCLSAEAEQNEVVSR